MPGPSPRPCTPRPRREAGFTLVELLVSLLLLAELILAALVLFDFNNKVARVQTHVADMQQNLRVAMDEAVRSVRMGGRGGLPAVQLTAADPADRKILPTGVAVEVRNDVGPDATILVGDADSPAVAEGTDVLTVRGVFSTPLLLVNYQDSLSFSIDPDAGTGIIRVRATTTTGVEQDLDPLLESVARELPEALVIVNAVTDDVYGVVELVPGATTSEEVDGIQQVTLSFVFPPDPGAETGTHALEYARLSAGGALSEEMRSAVSVGILEEYRFFVREDFSTEFGAPDLQPRLSRLRVYPNTEVAWNGEEAVDVADNILDLQVALGVDTDADDLVAEAAPGASADDFAADEWLLNHDADDPADAVWQAPANRLFYVRLNMLARTDRRDPNYVSPPIERIEDRPYDENAVPDSEENRRERLFRRRQMSTVIDLRNLS